MNYTEREIEAVLAGLTVLDRSKLWLLVRCVDIERALAVLPDAYYDAVVLVGAGQLPLREASNRLGVSHVTVGIRYKRGLEYMADYLNGRM